MELKDLNRKMDELQRSQQKILNYLHNDTGTGELGLVADFKQHKNKVNDFIKDQQQKEAVSKARVGLLATIFGFLGAAVLKIGTFFFQNHN